MGQIVIKCPKTGQLVSTGMAMNWQSYTSATLTQKTLSNCPECGDSHTWDKTDTQLLDG